MFLLPDASTALCLEKCLWKESVYRLVTSELLGKFDKNEHFNTMQTSWVKLNRSRNLGIDRFNRLPSSLLRTSKCENSCCSRFDCDLPPIWDRHSRYFWSPGETVQSCRASRCWELCCENNPYKNRWCLRAEHSTVLAWGGGGGDPHRAENMMSHQVETGKHILGKTWFTFKGFQHLGIYKSEAYMYVRG